VDKNILDAIGTVIASALAFYLAWNRRSEEIAHCRERRIFPTHVTLAVDEQLDKKLENVDPIIQRSIDQHLGSLRRDIIDKMGSFELVLRASIGESKEDRQLAEEDRKKSEAQRLLVREEINMLRKTTEGLMAILDRLAKAWS
jgi:hypothetical protein